VRFRVEHDTLAEAVAWAARTLPTRPSLPMLAGLMIESRPAGLTLSSFDYEVSARVEIPAQVEDGGRVLVSGRLLADIARALPTQPVEITVEGSRAEVRCGRSTFVLPTLPVEDYPTLPSMPTTSGTVPGATFATAVHQVTIAAGRDDTLPTLTGVRVEIVNDLVTLAATDRYRLAVREFSWSPEQPGLEATALVPARTLAETSKSLAGCEIVQLALASGGVGEGLIGFEGDGRRTTSRLLDGEFPKYRALLPTESATLASVDTATLVEAVKRVALVADRGTPIRLAFKDSEVVLRAGTGDEAQAEDQVECGVDGDAIEIAFNPTYLLEGLAAIDAPVAKLSFINATRPAVLYGAASLEADMEQNYRYLLMPVRLAN